MSHEYLSDAQVDRYGRFVADPTPEELEKFFFLDAVALKEAQGKRRLRNRLSWSIQWGTVRMLGTFMTDSGPAEVPESVIRYVAEQLKIEDWTSAKLDGDRPQTPYEHAAQIRQLLGYREFSAAESDVATFIVSRVRKTRDSRRELFDQAVFRLIENRCCCRASRRCRGCSPRCGGPSWRRSTGRWPRQHRGRGSTEPVGALELLPSTEDDGDLEWRVELVERFGMVRPFIDMLAPVIPWGGDGGGLADPGRAAGTAPADGGPQARPRAHQGVRGPGDRIPAAPGLRKPQAGPTVHLRELAELLDGAYR
ncbi:DUF4158 domain-containing protein [Streptosporangium roseum]|uniref:DUF4158 domain-containing protein n=1 Tax=Streptosporangium roseum TaxID=2001 RepID=UPI00332D0485